MTLNQLKTKADTVLLDIWTAIVNKEDAYFAKHGRYFGLNWTPATPVVDGVDTDLGELQKPSRFFDEADVSFPVNYKTPFQIQIIRHDGPEGQGYTAWARATLPNGDVYMRSKGRGAHSQDNPWFKYEDITQR